MVNWLRELRQTNQKAWAHCRARIELLAQLGHELRHYLRDGIYELRAKQRYVQYRILYFFHECQVAILAHTLTKQDTIPGVEIERAVKRKRLFEANPRKHTYESET